jgi:hypothetical protein
MVNALVTSIECPINALTRKKWTAAHLVAEHRNTRIMKTLRSAPGIDFNIKNDDGHIPLHVSALKNSVGFVKIILDWNFKLCSRQEEVDGFLAGFNERSCQGPERLRGESQQSDSTRWVVGLASGCRKWLRRRRQISVGE